jgi:hypothetical protein
MMLCHMPTTFGTGITDLDTFLHAADFLATLRTGGADFSTDFTQTMLKLRIAELKIYGGLANLSTVHHQPKVLCFNLLAVRV